MPYPPKKKSSPEDPFAPTPMRGGPGIGEPGGLGSLDPEEPAEGEPLPSLKEILDKVASGDLSPEEAEPQVRNACALED